MLLCTAAGEPGKLDVFLGAEVARSVGARATLLFVEDPDFGARRPRRNRSAAAEEASAKRHTLPWIRRHLDQGLRTLEGQAVDAESKIRIGPALDEILAEATEGDYDIIVIGGHLRRTWFKVPEKDLTTDLLLQAGRPVLIVKGALDR